MTKYRRPLLIAGVFLTGYLLLLQWQADYGAEKENPKTETLAPPVTEEEPREVTPPPVTEETQEILKVPQEQKKVDAQGTKPSPLPISPEQETISVETDKLKLEISKRGGDIVRAGIKDHRQRRDSPNPLLLLLKDRQRLAVAQSGLIGLNGFDGSTSGRPVYKTNQDSFFLDADQKILRVPLFYSENGVTLVKEFVLQTGEYQLDVNFLIDNQGDEPWQGNMFAQFLRDDKQPLYTEETLGMRSFTGAALTLNEKAYKKLSFSDMRKRDLQETVHGGWMAMVQHYFVSAWLPADKQKDYVYSTDITSRNEYIFGFTAPAFQVLPGERAERSLTLYMGPKYQSSLEALAPKIALTVDYGWLWYISQPLFQFLSFIHKYVGNWGVAIVVMTFIIKLVFFPLTHASYKSMARMRKLQPQVQNLRENYKDNRQRMQEEMMKLYKREKVNPMGGCLPILIQMPIFISFYWTLVESVELRHAPFYLWIDDLTALDPYFILPLLMGLTMFIQQQLSPAPGDPTQAKIMKFLPVVFTIFFLWFPAGLVLYWLVNNTLSIGQQYFITRRLNLADGKNEPVFNFPSILKRFKK